ncbi:hypothetical protein GGX14DRAFT_677463 [Mycena pura]|uniref:Secreted protein n=1 Tax=Mycena pura TaxID=153505 RepID=A0AAD6UWB4_9AGAR|nr:hypothetical protein GGX14DRAFT_677463 [Mycena pura]
MHVTCALLLPVASGLAPAPCSRWCHAEAHWCVTVRWWTACARTGATMARYDRHLYADICAALALRLPSRALTALGNANTTNVTFVDADFVEAFLATVSDPLLTRARHHSSSSPNGGPHLLCIITPLLRRPRPLAAAAVQCGMSSQAATRRFTSVRYRSPAIIKRALPHTEATPRRARRRCSVWYVAASNNTDPHTRATACRARVRILGVSVRSPFTDQTYQMAQYSITNTAPPAPGQGTIPLDEAALPVQNIGTSVFFLVSFPSRCALRIPLDVQGMVFSLLFDLKFSTSASAPLLLARSLFDAHREKAYTSWLNLSIQVDVDCDFVCLAPSDFIRQWELCSGHRILAPRCIL